MNEEQQKLTLFNRILNGIKQVPETVIDKGSNLFENIMLGREIKEPESSIENKDGNVVIQTGVNNGGRTGGLVGFVGDVVGGAKENMNTTFSPKNLYSNDRKGFGYRLGEGLGSAVRLLDNPLVRGAVAYGLSKHMGDSNPLEQGFIATGTNMRNKAVDRVYRNDLINSRKASLMNNPNWNTLSPEEENEIMTRVTSMAGYRQMQPEQQRELLTAARTNYLNNRQQEQLKAIENEINGYRGFIDNSIYDNMIQAQQLRDNAAYRQMYFDAQLENQKRNEALARERFEYQKIQDKIQNNMAWEKLKNEKNNGPVSFSAITTVRKEFEGLPVIKNFNEINRQMGNVKSIYEKYKQGNLKANANDQVLITTINKILDPTSVVRESEFNRTAQGQALTDKLQGYLRKISKGGSGLTDAERNDMFEAMETMYLATQQEAYNAAEYYTDLAMRYNINPADIVSPKYLKPQEIANNSQESQVIQSGKYKVRVR